MQKLQGLKRRVIYVTLYEFFAVVLSALVFAASSTHELSSTWVLAVITSLTAVTWNFFFNLMFEAWEARQPVKGRSVARRVAHALGFEGGLGLFLIPLIAWWLELGLWQALVLNLGLMLFFLVYTYVFAWTFDRVFGLPASAMESGQT